MMMSVAVLPIATAPLAPLAVVVPMAAISISPAPSLVPPPASVELISIVPRFTTAPIAPPTVMVPVPLISWKFSAVSDSLSTAPSIVISPAPPVPVVIFVELPPSRRILPVLNLISSSLVMNSTALVLVILILSAPVTDS